MRKVGAVILAAGGSTRLGESKQFLLWEGETLIRRAVRAATEAGCAPVAVVIGETGERVSRELRETPAEVVANPDWERGLGTSIRCGVQHLREAIGEVEALLLLTCDQPFVETSVLARLITKWETSGRAMVASRYAETLGIPALFDRSCFAELLALPDASGAKSLFQAGVSEVAEIEFEEGAFDIDTTADYARAKARIEAL